jgi:hypothetical protein
MTRRRFAVFVIGALVLLVAGTLYVSTSVRWKNRALVLADILVNGERPRRDNFSRITLYPGKARIPCPAQDERTAVLLLIGQSNMANQAERRHASSHGERIVNFYGAECYAAASPLLGATGTAGESWTLAANKLIENGAADRVILIPAAVGGTPIQRWRKGADINTSMSAIIRDVQLTYRITGVIWNQGESDFRNHTSHDAYRRMFLSLVASLREQGVDAPVFVSVASRCTSDWTPDNPVSLAQRGLPSPEHGIYPGVDSDALITGADRYDGCHFAASGQEKFASAWAELLRNFGINGPSRAQAITGAAQP